MRRSSQLPAATLLLLLTLACQAPADTPEPSRRPTPSVEYPPLLVSPDALARMQGESRPLLLDLRGTEQYEAGHLPGARRLDHETGLTGALVDGNPARFAHWLAGQGIGRERPLLLYGDQFSREALGRLFWALEWAGCRSVRVLDGGIDAWLLRGEAIETGWPQVQRGPPGPERGRSTRPRLRVDSAWLEEHLDPESECELLDLRGDARWRSGHIPQALPYDFGALLPENGSWPDPAQARREFERREPRPDDHVDPRSTFILYGEDNADPRPGLGYLLLRLMGLRAAVQAGGWTAWRAADLPFIGEGEDRQENR